jgi:hypothetical protein
MMKNMFLENACLYAYTLSCAFISDCHVLLR